MSKKTWDDNLLFYGGEALVLLVAEGYIVYHTYEGPSTLPFCLGLMITALVAGVGMHWALTKKSKALKGSGYFVWLAITLIVCVTAGVLWTANDRLKQHNRSLAETESLKNAEVVRHTETKKAETETELTAKLATVKGFGELLDKAKTQSERSKVLRLGKEVLASPSATPETIESQVAAVMRAAPVASIVVAEWRPFPPNTFFNWVYEDLVRFCAVIGIAGLGLLLGVFIIKRDEESALQVASRGATTQHVVTTSGPQHGLHVTAGQPRVVMGYAPPQNPDPNSTTNRT